MNNKRTVYLDYLRVFAIIAVITIHSCGYNWGHTDVNTYNWQILNAWDSIVRWGVPVFVMISGALFLGRDIPIKKIYSKYILRIVIAFFVWSTFYAFINGGTPIQIAAHILCGNFHMWFLPMIVGLYMALPIIRKIVENETIMKCFLVLSVVFATLMPTLLTIVNSFAPAIIVKSFGKVYGALISGLSLNIVTGYVLYFVLGYRLNKTELSKKQRTIIYILGLVGFASTILLNSVVSVRNQGALETFYGYFSFNVFLESIGVFTWFKYNCPKVEKLNAVFAKLSKYSFGAYLVHIFVLNSLTNMNSLMFNPIFAVPVLVLTVAVGSFVISAVLNHIPVLKKYIV